MNVSQVDENGDFELFMITPVREGTAVPYKNK